MWDYFEDLENYLGRRKGPIKEFKNFDNYVPYLKPSCLFGYVVEEKSEQDKKGIGPFFSKIVDYNEIKEDRKTLRNIILEGYYFRKKGNFAKKREIIAKKLRHH